MAKSFAFKYLPSVTIPDTYVMIGETRINHFHQTAEIHVYLFTSEDARRQRLSENEVDEHRPLKTIVVHTTIDNYRAYLEEPAKALAAAGYKLISEVEESAAANPRGLKNLLANAEDK